MEFRIGFASGVVLSEEEEVKGNVLWFDANVIYIVYINDRTEIYCPKICVLCVTILTGMTKILPQYICIYFFLDTNTTCMTLLV